MNAHDERSSSPPSRIGGTITLAPARGRMQSGELVVEAGPDRGARLSLEPGSTVLGSSDDCDLSLSDDTVSGRHCELINQGERVLVRDLGSRNGVVIAGVQVQEAWLEPDVPMQLGNTRVRLDAKLREVALSAQPGFGPLFGTSAAMRAIFAQLPALAASPAPVLIEGETGTGKDLTAEAIHQTSPRAAGPFVLFDCGSVAASLLEAELFGHEKSAFTGANAARAGLAERADGGTLVLDEIGELPLELQPKLLRLVERQEVRRVGSNTSLKLDVRIIACTHRSLRVEARAKRFREDLYYRLSALRVKLPALRDRTEDLPGLVDRLLAVRGSSQRFDSLPQGDRELLMRHRWPGNIRELRNVVERLVTFPSAGAGVLLDELETGRVLTSPGVPPAPVQAAPALLQTLQVARQQVQDDFERRYVERVLAQAGGSWVEAARIAGVSRQLLQRLAKRHGLK